MTDNVIKLHKGKGTDETPPQGPTADEVLNAALGKYDDVILIGIRHDAAVCSSTVGIDEAIYELTRAIHRLNCFIDQM